MCSKRVNLQSALRFLWTLLPALLRIRALGRKKDKGTPTRRTSEATQEEPHAEELVDEGLLAEELDAGVSAKTGWKRRPKKRDDDDDESDDSAAMLPVGSLRGGTSRSPTSGGPGLVAVAQG